MNQTWPFKDITAKAKKGRYFPITFSEAIHATRRWSMLSDAGARVRIHFENTTWEESDDLMVLAYRPEHLLVIGSWPDAVSPDLGRLAIAKGFPMIAAPESLSKSQRATNVTRWYLVLRSTSGTLGLVERHLHFQSSAYRGGEKFSNAFKHRIRRIEDCSLPVSNELEPDEKLAKRGIAAA